MYILMQRIENKPGVESGFRASEKAIRDGERDAGRIKQLLQEIIGSSPRAEIDYAEIYDAYDLADIQQIDRKY